MLIHQPLAFGWLQGNKGGREKPHETPNYVVTAFSFLAHEEKRKKKRKRIEKSFFPTIHPSQAPLSVIEDNKQLR